MKVLHLVAGNLTGGAARGAYFLHKAQRELGIESILVTNSPITNKDQTVISLASSTPARIRNGIISRLGRLPTYLYTKRLSRMFNTGIGGYDITKLPEYQEADIVHLHWINGLVSMWNLRKIKKPIVWTLRDMWPLTGGCHYSMDCDRYKVGCGYCPQLQSRHLLDLSKSNRLDPPSQFWPV